jgi:predicted transcriptional regulator of viral defense system
MYRVKDENKVEIASSTKDISEFLEINPVFTLKDLQHSFGVRQASDLIFYYKKKHRVGAVKEGLYYAVKPGKNPSVSAVDSYLLASKITEDSVIAFHTALELLGYAHSLFSTVYFFSRRARPAMRFRETHFRCVMVPEALQKKSAPSFGTETTERLGVKVTLTGKERTLVEALERPHYCGGFEEMYRSLEKMPFIQTEIVHRYLDLREQKNLFARTGYFLERHREQFQVEESFLKKLERSIPAQPLYWDRSKKGGVLNKRWNLIVPEAVDKRNWEEH